MSFLRSSVFLACILVAGILGDDPPGHLMPLGSHRPPDGEIDVVEKPPSPQDFYDNYVNPGRPLLFKGAAKNMPAFNLWTDEYLSNKFGSIDVEVEEGKKENRSWNTFNFKMEDFIKRYKKEDIYMVESLKPPMREDYRLLKSLSCGGFTRVLQDAVMWFSSGGTKSVIHFDALENINCLLSGQKNLIMINKIHKPLTHIDEAQGSYSNADVEKVDMYKYPGLGKVPWMNASMEAGDCFYIPFKWIHQVKSYGNRNLAVNIWWAHFTQFNAKDCETNAYKDMEFVPLKDFELKEHESVRQDILQHLGGDPVDKQTWVSKLQIHATEHGYAPLQRQYMEENFEEVDANKDGMVTADEIMDVEGKDIIRLLASWDEEPDTEEGTGPEEGAGPEGKENTEETKTEEDPLKDEL